MKYTNEKFQAQLSEREEKFLCYTELLKYIFLPVFQHPLPIILNNSEQLYHADFEFIFSLMLVPCHIKNWNTSTVWFLHFIYFLVFCLLLDHLGLLLFSDNPALSPWSTLLSGCSAALLPALLLFCSSTTNTKGPTGIGKDLWTWLKKLAISLSS